MPKLLPQKHISILGVSFAWLEAPPEEIKVERAFNVSYIMVLEQEFWDWAVAPQQNVFDYLPSR